MLPLWAITAGKATGGFITANWKPLLAIAIVGLMYWKYHSMQTKIADLTKDNAVLVQDNKDLTRDNTRLVTIIDTQSNAVNAIKGLGDKFDARMGDLGADLKTQRSEFNKRLDKLRQTPAPQTSDESVDYIIQGLPYLKSPKNETH